MDRDQVDTVSDERLARSAVSEIAMALHWIDGSGDVDRGTALRHALVAREQLDEFIDRLEE